MLEAKSVYRIAKELSNKELWKLYRKIGEDLYEEQHKLKGAKKKHHPISRLEMQELLLTKIFKAKLPNKD